MFSLDLSPHKEVFPFWEKVVILKLSQSAKAGYQAKGERSTWKVWLRFKRSSYIKELFTAFEFAANNKYPLFKSESLNTAVVLPSKDRKFLSEKKKE